MDANGYGLTGRVGWTFDRLLAKTQVTPFGSYTYSTIHFGYNESTGRSRRSSTASPTTRRLRGSAPMRVTPSRPANGCGARWPGRIASTAARAPTLAVRQGVNP